MAENVLFGGIGKAFKPKTSLLDRALNDLGNIASGFVPGMLELGSATINDAYAAAPFTPNKFKLPELGKGMAQGLWNESALPPLLLGSPGEALKRASERPVSALLDASLIPSGLSAGARLGVSTGIGRQAGLGFLGYDRVSNPIIAEQILSSSNKGVDGGGFISDLPAAIDLDNAGTVATREWLPNAGSPLRNFGGDLYLRRGRRTLTPGKQADVVIDGDYTREDMASLNYQTGRTEGLDQLDSMSTRYLSPKALRERNITLGEDPLLNMTKDRSSNETMAHIGDGLSFLLNKIPSNKWYSQEKRIGKGVVGQANSMSRLERDVAMSRVMSAMKDAAKVVAARMGIPEEEAKVRLANSDFLRSLSLKSLEELDAMISNYDGLAGLADEGAWSTANARPLSDLYESMGIRITNSEKGPDYAYHEDPQFNGVRLADFLSQMEPEIRRSRETIEIDADGNPILDENGVPKKRVEWTSPISFEVHSRNYRNAHRDYLDTKEIEQGVLTDQILNLAKAGHTMRLRNENTGEVIDLSEPNQMQFADPADFTEGMPEQGPTGLLLSDENMDRIFGGDDGAWTPVYAKTGVGDDVAARSIIRSMNESIANVRKARHFAETIGKHSNQYVKGYRMYGDNAGFEARSDSRQAGIAERLAEIRDNTLDPELDADEIRQFYSVLDDLRSRGAETQKVLKGDTLFDDAAQMSAEQRHANWARGDKQGHLSYDDAVFYPMVKEQSAPVGKRVDGVIGDDAIYEPWRKDDAIGDPLDVFLEGKFRTDWETVLNDFQRNRQYRVGHDIMKALSKMSLRISREQYERMKVHNREVTEAEAIEGKHFQGAYVAIPRDGAYSRKYAEMSDMLNGLKRDAAINGHNVEAIAEVQELARRFSMDRPDMVAESGNASDIPAAAIRVDGPLDDDVTVISADIYRAAYREMEISRRAMNAIVEMGTELWKYTVLHARFLSWMRNNIIGGHLMVGMAGGPKAYARSLAFRMSKDYEAMADLVKQEMPDVFASASSSQARAVNMKPADTKMGKLQRKAAPLSDFNSKFADDPVREMRLFQLMQEHFDSVNTKPEDLTIDVVRRYMEDDVLRLELARRTKTDMVDFSDMTEAEKRYLRSIFPFYSWMKGSTKATARMAGDHPGRVWAAGQFADMHEREMEEKYGHFVPDFAKAWWDPGEAGGLTVNTGGMNPFQTTVDFLAQGMSMVPNIPLPFSDESIRMGPSYRQFGSENILSGMHPAITGVIQGASGRDLFFGTPLPQNSFGSTFLGEQASIPPVAFLSKLIKNETGPDATTEYNPLLASGNYLAGIPLVDPRPGKVRSRGVDELNERYKSPLAWRELSLSD